MEFAALIPIAGIFSGVAIMWICYKVLELRVVGRSAREEADLEAGEKKKLELEIPDIYGQISNPPIRHQLEYGRLVQDVAAIVEKQMAEKAGVR